MSRDRVTDYTVREVSPGGLVFSKEEFDVYKEYGEYFASLPKVESVKLKPWQVALSIGGVALLSAGLFSGAVSVDKVHAQSLDLSGHSFENGLGHGGEAVAQTDLHTVNHFGLKQSPEKLILGSDPKIDAVFRKVLGDQGVDPKDWEIFQADLVSNEHGEEDADGGYGLERDVKAGTIVVMTDKENRLVLGMEAQPDGSLTAVTDPSGFMESGVAALLPMRVMTGPGGESGKDAEGNLLLTFVGGAGETVAKITPDGVVILIDKTGTPCFVPDKVKANFDTVSLEATPVGSDPVLVEATPLPPSAETLSPEVQKLVDVQWLTEFSILKGKYPKLPSDVKPGDISAAMAVLDKGMQIPDNLVLFDAFEVSKVTGEGVEFDMLVPTVLVNGKLQNLEVGDMSQYPIVATRGAVIENYFKDNYPDLFNKWVGMGAVKEDYKDATLNTLIYMSKHGPLYINYITTGRYLNKPNESKDQLSGMRSCMWDQSIPDTVKGKSGVFEVPYPIGSPVGPNGKLPADTFGSNPMGEVAERMQGDLQGLEQSVAGVVIDSPEALARVQAEFNKNFMIVMCGEPTIK